MLSPWLCCAWSFISIQLKDQESTGSGKRYSDKQNSKYLHPKGLQCTSSPFLLPPFLTLCLSRLLYSPFSLFLAIHLLCFFHVTFPQLSILFDTSFQKRDVTAWIWRGLRRNLHRGSIQVFNPQFLQGSHSKLLKAPNHSVFFSSPLQQSHILLFGSTSEVLHSCKIWGRIHQHSHQNAHHQ